MPNTNNISSSLYSFQEIRPSDTDWDKIEQSSDSTCFHTRQWNKYIKRIGYKPFVAIVKRDEQVIGYFIGTRMWLGIRLICAPLDSLGYTQGLVTLQPISPAERVNIYQQLAAWIVYKHKADYLSIDDWQLREDRTEWISEKEWRSEVLDAAGMQYSVRSPLYLPLNKTKEDLWADLHYKSAKYSINKARKLGLEVQEITKREDIAEFVRVHYEQLCEVSHRHNTGKPKLGQKKRRLLAICEELFPNRVMMLKVVGQDENGIEQVMSTGIFLIDKGESSYYTGASYTRYQKYCPNELMVWEAIVRLNERGAGNLNFGGMASYKLKFGTIYAYVPHIVFARTNSMVNFKTNLKRIYYYFRKTFGKLR